MQVLVVTATRPLGSSSVVFKQDQDIQRCCGVFRFGLGLLLGRGGIFV